MLFFFFFLKHLKLVWILNYFVPSYLCLLHPTSPKNPKPQIHKLNTKCLLKMIPIFNEFSRQDQGSLLREREMQCGGPEARGVDSHPFLLWCDGWARPGGGEEDRKCLLPCLQPGPDREGCS